MGRLREYFESAATNDLGHRRLGIEVETLFLDRTGSALSEATGRQVFSALTERGWRVADDEKSLGRELRRGGFAIKPEIGAGNIELITPPHPTDKLGELLEETRRRLDELYAAAGTVGAEPVFDCYDGCQDVDNILRANERDERWTDVDGADALKCLAHIASVHVTIDLASLDEGFELIGKLNALGKTKGWPNDRTVDVWKRYLESSRVDYDTRRFGPAPERFDDYLALLRRFRVVMDRDGDDRLRRLTPDPPRLASVEETVDLPTFLGTVWFNTRLRVISGQLLLETRFIPRGPDRSINDDLHTFLSAIERPVRRAGRTQG